MDAIFMLNNPISQETNTKASVNTKSNRIRDLFMTF